MAQHYLRAKIPPVLAVLAAIGAVALSAQTSDRARTEAESRRAAERLQALQREADSLATQERSLLVDLRRLEVERDIRTEELKQADANADKVARDLGTIGNQIDVLASQDTASRPALEARMVELYKLGGAGYVHLLFSVSDLREFGRAYRMVSALAAMDRQRVTEHRQNLNQLEKARALLEQRKVQMGRIQHEAVEIRAKADQAAMARGRLIAQIDARRDLTAQLAAELQIAQQKLQQTLGSFGASGSATAWVALPIRPFRGDLDWPVPGRVMTRFNLRASGTPTSPLQNGIQISADEGTPARAVHGGLVAFAGPFTGFGNLVIVDHGAQTYSLYGQLDAVNVTRGTRIERGQTLGTTGLVLFGIPGMYFEMRVDGNPVDPLEWLKKRP